MLDTATCERTGKKIKMNEGHFVCIKTTGEWSFVGPNVPDGPNEFDIRISDLLQSPFSFSDRMAHLNETEWFDPQKFFDFFTRFRENYKASS